MAQRGICAYVDHNDWATHSTPCAVDDQPAYVERLPTITATCAAQSSNEGDVTAVPRPAAALKQSQQQHFTVHTLIHLLFASTKDSGQKLFRIHKRFWQGGPAAC
jgi:hypothetical protein